MSDATLILFDELWKEVDLNLDVRSHCRFAATSWGMRRLVGGFMATIRRYVAEYTGSSMDIRKHRSHLAFISAELDVAMLFDLHPAMFRFALSQTALARRVRPWLSHTWEASNPGVVIAGGASRAAVLDALRLCRAPGIQPELTDVYGDVDIWLDLSQLANPYPLMERLARVSGAPLPFTFHCPTVASTLNKQIQCCAWNRLAGHAAGCIGEHPMGATPMACFDQSAIQFALSGPWFDPAASSPCLAVCTRMAAYSLVSRESYPVRYCIQQYDMGGDYTLHNMEVYRVLRRALKLHDRGHDMFRHELGCRLASCQKKDEHDRPRAVLDPMSTRMNMDYARTIVELPANIDHNRTGMSMDPEDVDGAGYLSRLGKQGLRLWNDVLDKLRAWNRQWKEEEGKQDMFRGEDD
jgi:hypothetical protein